LRTAFKDISDVGFRHVEISNIPETKEEEGEISSFLGEYALDLIAAYFGGNYIDKEDFEYEFDDFDKLCRFLEVNNAKHVVVGGGLKKQEGNSEEDYQFLANALNEMGFLAAEHNIKLCYHPHRGTMVEFPDQIKLIADLTDKEFVSFCFDTAHLASGGGEPKSLCKKYVERLAYIHLKDLDFASRFVELGKGDLDIKGIWEVLQEIGFDGPIVIELDSADDCRQSCENNMKFLKNVLGFEF